MKGKKINSIFLSDFITECVKNNKMTSDDILQEAKYQIKEIDSKIIEIEKLKKKRSDLLDVVYTFDKSPTKKTNDTKALSFFKISNLDICKSICNLLKEKPVDIKILENINSDKNSIIYCIKQLLEINIISRSGDIILRGESYHDFMNYVFKES